MKIGAFAGKTVKSSRFLFDAVRVDGRQPITEEQLTTLLLTLDRIEIDAQARGTQLASAPHQAS